MMSVQMEEKETHLIRYHLRPLLYLVSSVGPNTAVQGSTIISVIHFLSDDRRSVIRLPSPLSMERIYLSRFCSQINKTGLSHLLGRPRSLGAAAVTGSWNTKNHNNQVSFSSLKTSDKPNNSC